MEKVIIIHNYENCVDFYCGHTIRNVHKEAYNV